MESKTYLLVFSILLTYYSYLCDICGEIYYSHDCGVTAGYDELGIYSCTFENREEGVQCLRSLVKGNISSCESAVDEIIDILQPSSLDFNFDSGSCEKINNNCYYDENDRKCHLRKCEELKDNCTSLQYCGFYENTCKINDCQGINNEKNCKIITLDKNNKLFCKWENNICKTITNCTEGSTECSLLPTSGEDYICFSDGEKCVESNSCENVKVININSKDELSSICSNFSHCLPGNNYDCTNACNNITSEDECNYSLIDNETFIKCKWVNESSDGKKCQVDGNTEIKTCKEAINANDMTNDQCSKLKVTEGNYCRKGPDGCFEFEDCDDINVEVDPDICMELTKPNDDLQCIPSETGCKKDKVKCSQKSLYNYDNIKCEKLNISLEGYKCLSNGKECIEVNLCDSINDTSYEANSDELKTLCGMFDNCEPYENGCKTKYIPTTIITTIPEIITTLPTTTLPTTIPTTILTTIFSTILTTMTSSILRKENSTIIETEDITIQSKEPSIILTTKTITTSTTDPDSTQTTALGTTSTTSPTTTLTTTASSIISPIITNNTTSTATPTTIPSIPTNIPSTIPNLTHTSITTNIPTNAQRNIPTIITTNISTNIPYITTTNIPTTIPNLTHNTFTTNNIPRIIPTTIENTELMIPSTTVVANLTSNESVRAIFLGLSHFKKNPSYYSFHIYFTPIINVIYSQIINFKGIIDYYTNMRVLKETEGNCTLQNVTNLKYRYYCIDYEDTENIKSIKILPDFAFVNQDIDIIGVSPIAKPLIDNLLLYDERYDEKYDQLYNSTIYLMDNSTHQTNGKLSFNITGIINGTQPKIEKKDISLMVSLQSGQKTEVNLDCVINNIHLENYQLNCKSNKPLIIDLKGAISFIDNDGLLVLNFIDGINTIIELKDINSYNKLFFSKKNNGLNPGAIVAIIIVLVVVVAAVISLAYYLRKKEKIWKEKEKISNSSAIINLKN